MDRPRSGTGILTSLNESVHFLKKTLQRQFGDLFSPSVADLSLSRPGLFSSRRADRLLIHSKDFGKVAWKPGFVERGICGLLKLQRQAQRDGDTAFVVMIAPDKLSIYHQYAVGNDGLDISWISRIASDGRLLLPRIDLALTAAVHAGVRDVYLPDDTHWGYAGHQIAAQALHDYLAETGILVDGGHPVEHTATGTGPAD